MPERQDTEIVVSQDYQTRHAKTERHDTRVIRQYRELQFHQDKLERKGLLKPSEERVKNVTALRIERLGKKFRSKFEASGETHIDTEGGGDELS